MRLLNFGPGRLAFISLSARVPKLERNVDVLVNVRSDGQVVAGASSTTPVEGSVLDSGVVNHNKRVRLHVSRVERNPGHLNTSLVIFDGHPEFSVVGVGDNSANFCLEGFRPEGRIIGPVTEPAFRSPRVSTLHQSGSIAQLMSSQHREGMSLH